MGSKWSFIRTILVFFCFVPPDQVASGYFLRVSAQLKPKLLVSPIPGLRKFRWTCTLFILKGVELLRRNSCRVRWIILPSERLELKQIVLLSLAQQRKAVGIFPNIVPCSCFMYGRKTCCGAQALAVFLGVRRIISWPFLDDHQWSAFGWGLYWCYSVQGAQNLWCCSAWASCSMHWLVQILEKNEIDLAQIYPSFQGNTKTCCCLSSLCVRWRLRSCYLTEQSTVDQSVRPQRRQQTRWFTFLF